MFADCRCFWLRSQLLWWTQVIFFSRAIFFRISQPNATNKSQLKFASEYAAVATVFVSFFIIWWLWLYCCWCCQQCELPCISLKLLQMARDRRCRPAQVSACRLSYNHLPTFFCFVFVLVFEVFCCSVYMTPDCRFQLVAETCQVRTEIWFKN